MSDLGPDDVYEGMWAYSVRPGAWFVPKPIGRNPSAAAFHKPARTAFETL